LSILGGESNKFFEYMDKAHADNADITLSVLQNFTSHEFLDQHCRDYYITLPFSFIVYILYLSLMLL